MSFIKQIKLWNNICVSLIILAILTSCSAGVTKTYNELDKKVTCRLTETVQGDNVNSINKVKLIVEKIDNHHVSLLFSLISFSYLTDMHINPKILFKIYSEGKVIKEFNLQAVSKNWDKSPVVQSHDPYNLDYASVVIDKITFEKIVHAEKMELLVQTNQDPAKFTFSKLDLKPFHKFMQTCFSVNNISR